MNAPDEASPSPEQSLSWEVDLPHAPEKVWRAITDPALLAEWLLPVFDFKLEPGAAFTFKTQAFPGWDGTVNCEMIEIDPLRKLVYAWRVPFLDTTVTFTITAIGIGTRLSIVQSGFKPDQKRELGGARYGWKMMGEKLTGLLERMP